MGQYLSRNSGIFATQFRLIISCFCILGTTFLGIGCDGSQTTANAKPEKNIAEVDFDWVIERLRRVIEIYTPSATLGLRVKQKLTYELLPPGNSRPEYTARVTVKSKTRYSPDRYTPSGNEKRKQARSFDPQAEDSAFAEEMLAKQANDPTAQLGSPSEKPLIVDPQIQTPSIDKKTVYELVYKDERWQLETQLESKHEQIWFEYALQR